VGENPVLFPRDHGLGVSCDLLLLRLRVAVELAEQGIAVLLSPLSKLLDKAFDLFASGFFQTLRSTEVDRIGLDQDEIELMPAYQFAETVANLRAGVISVGRLRRTLLRASGSLRRFGKRPDFLD